MHDLPDQTNRPDASIDVTRDVCPLTFVKTKLELEGLEKGQVLEVFVRVGEPLQNVTRSCEQDGHIVLSRTEVSPGRWRLLIQCGAAQQ